MDEGTDWVTRFENEDHREAMARLVAMHRCIGERIRTESAKDRSLRIVVLVISVLTSGALWGLIATRLPELASWTGAVLSTLVTGLILYQLTVGPGRQLEQLNDLYSEFGRSLAHARSHPGIFSWHNFKHLEASYIRLAIGDPTCEEVQDARENGML